MRVDIVLERARLVWTSLATKFTECTWSLELGGKLLNSLRIKTQFLERLQSERVVDGATHTQKDDVESNGGSLENVAEIFVLFLCDVQLVLRSGVVLVATKRAVFCWQCFSDLGHALIV